MTTFVDTNVLIAILNPSEPHHKWSIEQLEKCKERGPAVIANIVYSEFSIGMATKANVDAAVNELGLERLSDSDDVLFRAGMAYKKYRQNGGKKTNVLPDFLIGALAEAFGQPLITANKRDFVAYFPEIQIISPGDL